MTVFIVVDERYWNEFDQTRVFSTLKAAEKYREEIDDGHWGGVIVQREVDAT